MHSEHLLTWRERSESDRSHQYQCEAAEDAGSDDGSADAVAEILVGPTDRVDGFLLSRDVTCTGCCESMPGAVSPCKAAFWIAPTSPR